MDRLKKVALAGTLGLLVVAGSALGGGLLSAGAATSTSTQPSPSSSSGSGCKSNEDPAHEAAESAAREKAENDCSAGFGQGPDGDRGGPGFPNEDPAHEAGESAAREKAEHDGTAGPSPGAGSGSTQQGSISSGSGDL